MYGSSFCAWSSVSGGKVKWEREERREVVICVGMGSVGSWGEVLSRGENLVWILFLAGG